MIEKFFLEHKKTLEQFYPGITLNYIKRQLDDYHRDYDEVWLASFFAQLLQGVPFAQIFGKSYFYKNEFIVTKDTLIPRSETEILVERAVIFLKKSNFQDLDLIDVGTGTGAIVLSILDDVKNKNLRAMATDISKDALEVAKRNYKLIAPKHNLDFALADRLSGINGKFDLIVSNPPYINRIADRSGVHEKVDEFEPHLALYLDDEIYFEWFDLFFDQVKDHLKPHGLFLMEGHEDHLRALSGMLPGSQVIKDYTDRDRFLSFQFPEN